LKVSSINRAIDVIQIEEKITPQDKIQTLAKLHQQIIDSLEISGMDCSEEEIALLTYYATLRACPGQLYSTIKYH